MTCIIYLSSHTSNFLFMNHEIWISELVSFYKTHGNKLNNNYQREGQHDTKYKYSTKITKYHSEVDAKSSLLFSASSLTVSGILAGIGVWLDNVSLPLSVTLWSLSVGDVSSPKLGIVVVEKVLLELAVLVLSLITFRTWLVFFRNGLTGFILWTKSLVFVSL